MIKTSLPVAIIYGYSTKGTFELISDVYHEEYLHERVIVHSLDDYTLFYEHIAEYRPDVILTVGDSTAALRSFVNPNDFENLAKWFQYGSEPSKNILANDIVCQATFFACKSNNEVYFNPVKPMFSAFTGAYKTGERIRRTYQGLKDQTYPHWEWVVIDDSPSDHTETWDILQEIASKDSRVKVMKILPVSGGNVGEVKHRAASLCNGLWFFELDHDDKAISTLFEDCLKASKQYPDAGFIYTDVCELYEDGQMKYYGEIMPNRQWYGSSNNRFVWGYGGNEWVKADGESYISHMYPEINPKTIRFNIGMPNHARMWRRDVYFKVGGHNRFISVADDYELIVKTFLETKFLHVRKMLYLQFNNRNSTVDNNAKDINRKARLIRDYYDPMIHNKIQEYGCFDHEWIEEKKCCRKLQNDCTSLMYGPNEQILNYIYDPEE